MSDTVKTKKTNTKEKPKEPFNPVRFMDRPTELKKVPIEFIYANFDFNNRVNYGNIDWLAESIMTNGLTTPLVLYPEACKPGDEKAFYYNGTKPNKYPHGHYRLIVQDGHRRFIAITKAINELGAEIPTVECRRFDEGETKEERLLNQILMNSGKSLEPIETQAIFRELKNLGWSNGLIAKRTGCSEMHVGRMLELSSAEELTKYMIERGELSASLVLDTLPEVRQLASLEGKQESQVYSEIVQASPKTPKGSVSVKDFKQTLAKRRSEKLTQEDPTYYLNVSAEELLKRIALCPGFEKKDYKDPFYNVAIPSNVWNAVIARYKK